VAVPESDFTADVDSILEHITDRTRLIFLANPNNPTGTVLDPPAIQRLIDELPSHVMLALDAAYAEFAEGGEAAYDAGLRYADERPNVVVLRTFSKAYGLAALRVGWAYAPPLAARAMNRVRGVGNVNALGQAAAAAALADQDYLAGMLATVRAERARMTEALTDLGFAPLPSATNFLAIGVPETAGIGPGDLASSLAAEEAIIIRHLTDHGLPSHLRATVGTAQENDRLLAALSARIG
jgi:histidinol-phosphate aminotransferase